METIFKDPWFLAGVLSQFLLVILGAVVSLLDGWAKRNKAGVISLFVVFGCFGIIAAAKQASDAAGANAKVTSTLGNLSDSAKEIRRVTDLNTSLQEKLLDQGATISNLAHQAVSSVTGGDSFCFMTLAQDGKTLVLYNPGNYPLTEVEIDLTAYTSHREDHARIQTVIPHASAPYRFDLGNGDREDLGLLFSAVNGSWLETLQLRRVGGVWRKALKVERMPRVVKLDGTSRPKTIRQDVDPRYPRESSNQVQWCQFVAYVRPGEMPPNGRPNPCIPPVQ
jgi:hypothetical protein